MFRRRSRTHQAKQALAGRLPTTEEVRDQVAGVTDELADALDAAKDAITKAISSAGRRGTEAGVEATRKTAALGKEAGRKGVAAGRQASRRARGATLDAVGRTIPDPEQVAELTRRATEKVFPERARQQRKGIRKRRRRLLYGGVGLAALGVLMGWLTAPKRGNEARQALKERANAAGERVAEMRASAGSRALGGASTGTETRGAAVGAGTGDVTGTGAEAGMAGSREPGTGAQDQPAQQSADVTPIHQGDGATTGKRR